MTQVLQPTQAQIFDLPSGARLAMNVSPFVDAWALMKASLKTLKGASIKSEDLQASVSTLASNPSTFAFILDRLVEFATSPEVEQAIWKCARMSLYIPAGSPIEFPGMHVDTKLFDDQQYGNGAREDYAKIISCIMEVNCKPFLVRALSGLFGPKASANPGDPK